MKAASHLFAAITVFTTIQISIEKAITPPPYTSKESLIDEEIVDPRIFLTEDYYYTYNRGSTMVPRYLQLGNQTVDLNKLFRVPQESDGGVTFNHENNRRTPTEIRREEDLIPVPNVHRHSGGKHGGSRGHNGSHSSHRGRNSHGGSSHSHNSSYSGHSGRVHSQLDQMPWLRPRTQHEHDRRHGPHFEDASSDNASVTVQAGHTAHLDCKVSLLRDKTVSWVRRKAGEPPLLLTVGDQTYTGDGRFSVQFRYPGNWRLRLITVNKSDEGIYECQLSTHPPSVIRVMLKVDAPEVSIVDEFGVPLKEQYYEAGSTLHLRCIVRGIAGGSNSVWWLHGSQALHRDASRGGVAVKTEALRRGVVESSLRLGRLGPTDAGNYTCALPPAKAYSILVHVLNEESLAELQQGSSTSGPSAFVLLITCILLTYFSFS